MSESLLNNNDAEKAVPAVTVGTVKRSKVKVAIKFIRRPIVLVALVITIGIVVALTVRTTPKKEVPVAPKLKDPAGGLITDPVQIQKIQTEQTSGSLAR